MIKGFVQSKLAGGKLAGNIQCISRKQVVICIQNYVCPDRYTWRKELVLSVIVECGEFESTSEVIIQVVDWVLLVIKVRA